MLYTIGTSILERYQVTWNDHVNTTAQLFKIVNMHCEIDMKLVWE